MESNEKGLDQVTCSHNVQPNPLPNESGNGCSTWKEIVGNLVENSTDNDKPNNPMRFCEPISKSDDTHQRYYKAKGLPKELTDMFEPLQCMLCDVHVGSPMTAKAHYQGKSHIKKVKAYLVTWSQKTGNPMPELPTIHRSESILGKEQCLLCEVTFNSVADAEIHFSGKNHLKRVKNPDRYPKKRKTVHEPDDPSGRFGIGVGFISEKTPVVEVQKFYCDLCCVQAIDENQLKQHLNGARHSKALKAKVSTVIPAPAKPGDSILASVCKANESLKSVSDNSMHRTPSGYYYCQACNLATNSEEQFIQHAESKKHKSKLFNKKPQHIDKETILS